MGLDWLGVLGAGTLTFATPCVLPLLPIYLAALAGGGVGDVESGPRGRLISRALLFSIGFIAVFTALGLTATTAGAFVSEHRPMLQLAGAALILLFGLRFLGVIEIPIMDRAARFDDARLRTRFGAANAVLLGVVFAAGWSPCVGPALGAVLTYAASSAASPWTGAAYLSVYGLGMALPLLAAAALAGPALRFVRRLRPQLPRIERALGALLVAFAVVMVLDAVPSGRAGAAERADSTCGDDTESRVPQMVALVSSECPVCRRMEPLLERVEDHCAGRGVRIRRIDVADPANRGAVSDYGVVGVPTFLFLDRGGVEAERLIGEQSEQALFHALSEIRGEPCPDVDADAPPSGTDPGVADPPPLFSPGAATCAMPYRESPPDACPAT